MDRAELERLLSPYPDLLTRPLCDRASPGPRGFGAVYLQTIILFAAGNDARLWKLAQSLSALYPAGTEEKRWVDGVLARKKGWVLKRQRRYVT
jgi:hypothetical protein